MESSIAEFLSRQLACELLPTIIWIHSIIQAQCGSSQAQFARRLTATYKTTQREREKDRLRDLSSRRGSCSTPRSESLGSSDETRHTISRQVAEAANQ